MKTWSMLCRLQARQQLRTSCGTRGSARHKTDAERLNHKEYGSRQVKFICNFNSPALFCHYFRPKTPRRSSNASSTSKAPKLGLDDHPRKSREDCGTDGPTGVREARGVLLVCRLRS